jgi:carbon-monoxide dehydrogenase medium subunit
VAPTVVLADPGALIGAELDEAALQRLDAAARAVCRPIDDKRGTADYRIKIAGVLARRTATIAYQRATQSR